MVAVSFVGDLSGHRERERETRHRMPDMALMDRLRALFSPGTGEEAAAEREEYGLPDTSGEQLRTAGGPEYAGMETERLAEDDLDELKAPPDLDS
jgi:hypothetical protein